MIPFCGVFICRNELLCGSRNLLPKRAGSQRGNTKSEHGERVSRRLHGIIKKVGKNYKYYLTELGRHVAIAGLTLKNIFLIPEFAELPTTPLTEAGES